MERRFDRASPSSRLVLSAALDALCEVGYEGLTVTGVQARVGAAGALLEEADLVEVVASALEQVRVLPTSEPTGGLRADLIGLLRPWLARRGRDERAVSAVLSAAEWDPRIERAAVRAFDRPLDQAVGTLLADGRVAATRVHTLNWILRGLALDRLRDQPGRGPGPERRSA